MKLSIITLTAVLASVCVAERHGHRHRYRSLYSSTRSSSSSSSDSSSGTVSYRGLDPKTDVTSNSSTFRFDRHSSSSSSSVVPVVPPNGALPPIVIPPAADDVVVVEIVETVPIDGAMIDADNQPAAVVAQNPDFKRAFVLEMASRQKNAFNDLSSDVFWGSWAQQIRKDAGIPEDEAAPATAIDADAEVVTEGVMVTLPWPVFTPHESGQEEPEVVDEDVEPFGSSGLVTEYITTTLELPDNYPQEDVEASPEGTGEEIVAEPLFEEPTDIVWEVSIEDEANEHFEAAPITEASPLVEVEPAVSSGLITEYTTSTLELPSNLSQEANEPEGTAEEIVAEPLLEESTDDFWEISIGDEANEQSGDAQINEASPLDEVEPVVSSGLITEYITTTLELPDNFTGDVAEASPEGVVEEIVDEQIASPELAVDQAQEQEQQQQEEAVQE